ncbi:MAG: 7-carboxy-7-deazaguanine synthase QueE [Bacteroidales bacterium]|jgi:organic radical activating enzyme
MKNENKDIDANHLPVMETFYSLQGEGYHTGLASFFIRFGGCDLSCWFCDTKESWDPHLNELTSPQDLLDKAKKYKTKHVVLTGGEPILYPLQLLISLLHKHDYIIHLETAATAPLINEIDWVCLSPKNHTNIHNEWFQKANELKVIITEAKDLKFAEECSKLVSKNCHLFLQPEWHRSKILLPQIIEYILDNPIWRLSIQTHKFINIR